MKCPYCGYVESKVIDSRPSDEGMTIRRRRECIQCKHRFTTYEKIETIPVIVIKKDKTREVFQREKILNGLIQSCHKRPVSIIDMENVVNDVEALILNSMEKEISSEHIGALVMKKLQSLDEVAYVRFASVYRQFSDVETFVKEIHQLLESKKGEFSSEKN